MVKVIKAYVFIPSVEQYIKKIPYINNYNQWGNKIISYKINSIIKATIHIRHTWGN